MKNGNSNEFKSFPVENSIFKAVKLDDIDKSEGISVNNLFDNKVVDEKKLSFQAYEDLKSVMYAKLMSDQIITLYGMYISSMSDSL